MLNNAQEPMETLLYQQQCLIDGKRPVQMFPIGTQELPLPVGMQRIKNYRGVFHYNPAMINETRISYLSHRGMENEFLELGPFNKPEVEDRIKAGERFEVISEYTPDGVEVRTAAGTNKTLPVQKEYFERTKDPGNKIFWGILPQRVQDKLKENNDGSV